MKKIKESSLSGLTLDVVEYLFTAWLTRRGILPVYKANCEKFSVRRQHFQEDLRSHIRGVRRSDRYTFEDIITISFPYAMTPEGYEFWVKQSAAWRRFCNNFKSEF